MISFDHPLLLLLALPLFAAAIAFWLHAYDNLGLMRRRVALGVRLALLAAAILGLAGLALNLPQNRQAAVMVADVSASDTPQRSAIQSEINGVVHARPSGDEVGVVSLGRDARVEQPVSPLPAFDGFQTNVDRNYTNLADGLLLSNAILPTDFRRRITVMTDGRQNVGDAIATARLIHSLGVRVDVWPVHVSGGAEVLVDGVTMPSALRAKERFSVQLSVRSTVATSTRIDLYRDSTLVTTRQVHLRVGENRFTFDEAPLKSGFHTYQAQITPDIDTQPQNNVGSAFTLVAGPSRVLVVSPSRQQAANVLRSLQTTGIQSTFQTPRQVIPTLSAMQRYAAVVLVNTPADELDTGFTDALVPYVRDLGHGLVVIGGTESYGMGGYGQTGLEKALPVKMDLPRRKDLPSAAVVLVIESLEANDQINISKQAGKGVVNLLTPQDQIGIDDAEENGHLVVPLQHVVDKGRIDHAIDVMNPGDPMSYATDLQGAFKALKRARARVKHIILLGDGDAEDETYETLVKKIRAGGVTVSTVATNGLGFNDFQTMRDIARWGGGRYYRGDNPAAIPRIFLREARTVSRSGIIEGKFYPQELSANPMLKDLHGEAPLTGYVATTPKPTGEIVLASKKLDPVLAGWQFGLGRSVAWTSDATGEWTRDWLQAPGANRFWADLVSWTLPAAQRGKLFVSASSSEGQGHIAIDTPPSLGADPSVTAHVLGPDLHSTTVQLQPTAPGHFTGSFLANAQGSYFVTADARGVSHAEAGQAGLAVPYSAEYLTSGTDMAFARALARAGGGSVVSAPDADWQDNLSSVSARTALTNWLWLLALLLLPVDIGIRRLVVTRSDLAAIRAALARVRAPSTVGEPALAPLGALRSRRSKRAEDGAPAQPVRAPITPPGTVRQPAQPRIRLSPQAQEKLAPQASKPQPKPKPEPAVNPTAASTTSQLLAAKRRRK